MFFKFLVEYAPIDKNFDFIFYSGFIFTVFDWDKVKTFSQSILIR